MGVVHIHKTPEAQILPPPGPGNLVIKREGYTIRKGEAAKSVSRIDRRHVASIK